MKYSGILIYERSQLANSPKTFFSGDRFLHSVHKSFLNQATLDLRNKKWRFLNRDLTGKKTMKRTFKPYR